jgi:hypothetical protein
MTRRTVHFGRLVGHAAGRGSAAHLHYATALYTGSRQATDAWT